MEIRKLHAYYKSNIYFLIELLDRNQSIYFLSSLKNDYPWQGIELAIKGKFDAVLDTIGGPKMERIGVNFLKKGGRYITLQVG